MTLNLVGSHWWLDCDNNKLHHSDENNFTYIYGNDFVTVCEVLKEYHDKHLKSTEKKTDQAEFGLKL